uniref:TPT domain-containing protein n=1 Tax=Meloidogyne hapla TaxID=6305 RepID=A0A1I8BRQ8_MELHA
MAMVVAGWMFNAGGRYIMPLLSLTSIQTFYFSSILGCITNFVMACNVPVLYKFW